MLAFQMNGAWQEWVGQTRPLQGDEDGAYQLPRNAEAVFSRDDLAAYGLVAVTADPVPPGKRVASEELRDLNGAPHLSRTFEDIPPPSQDEAFPPLEPWRFEAIVEISGIGYDNLVATVRAHPDVFFRAKALAKLRNPPGGMFYRSDPLFADAALMAALKKTAADIDNLWLAALGLT